MNSVDDVMERARSAPWETELPSAQWIRAQGRRRRTRKTVTATFALAAACSLLAVAVPMGVRWFTGDTDAASGGPALVFIKDGADAPSSLVTGALEMTQDGCLLLAGDPAVLPRGSWVDGDQVHVAGTTPVDVRLGESVTLGGATFGLSGADVIDNLVATETRARFDACARASGSDSWVLVTTGS